MSCLGASVSLCPASVNIYIQFKRWYIKKKKARVAVFWQDFLWDQLWVSFLPDQGGCVYAGNLDTVPKGIPGLCIKPPLQTHGFAQHLSNLGSLWCCKSLSVCKWLHLIRALLLCLFKVGSTLGSNCLISLIRFPKPSSEYYWIFAIFIISPMLNLKRESLPLSPAPWSPIP